jgi:hypothetical protein
MPTPKQSFFRVCYLDNRTTLTGLRDKLNNLIDEGYDDSIYFEYDKLDGDIALYAKRLETIQEAQERELEESKRADTLKRYRAERKAQLIKELDSMDTL